MNEDVRINLMPQTQAKLDKIAQETGRTVDELVEDVLVGYLEEVYQLHQMIERRYDDLNSGRVVAIDGDIARARINQKSRVHRAERHG
jgi:predicted DNA-binding protein